jgi:hypothetical protein
LPAALRAKIRERFALDFVRAKGEDVVDEELPLPQPSHVAPAAGGAWEAEDFAEPPSPAPMGARTIISIGVDNGTLADSGAITPELLIDVLQAGKHSLFESLFGQMTGLRPPLSQRVIYGTGGEDLAIACRALQIDKLLFPRIFLLSRRHRPGNPPADPRELSRSLAIFDNMPAAAAREILVGWQREVSGYHDAAERF